MKYQKEYEEHVALVAKVNFEGGHNFIPNTYEEVAAELEVQEQCNNLPYAIQECPNVYELTELGRQIVILAGRGRLTKHRAVQLKDLIKVRRVELQSERYKARQAPNVAGYVYILTNPAMPGLVKVGRTNDVDRRLTELNQATGVPLPFEVAHLMEVNDAVMSEQKAHSLLDLYRVNDSREFFKIDPNQAYNLLREQA